MTDPYRKPTDRPHWVILTIWVPAMAVWAVVLAVGVALAHLASTPELGSELRRALAAIRWTG